MNTTEMESLRAGIIDAANHPLRHSDNAVSANALKLLAGGALFGLGLARRSTVGLLLAGAGAYLAYQGLQAVCCPEAFDSLESMVTGAAPCDAVEEASQESFPASDPPSYTTAAIH